MFRGAVGATAVAIAVFLAGQAVAFANPDATVADKSKVTICHATGSSSNPYVRLTISQNGLNGHGKHADDISSSAASACPAGTGAAVHNEAKSELSNPKKDQSGTNVQSGKTDHEGRGAFTVKLNATQFTPEHSVVRLVLEGKGVHDANAKTELVDVTDSVSCGVHLNGTQLKADSDVRVLLLRKVGSTESAPATPAVPAVIVPNTPTPTVTDASDVSVVHVFVNDEEVSSAATVSFGSTTATFGPQVPATTVNGQPAPAAQPGAPPVGSVSGSGTVPALAPAPAGSPAQAAPTFLAPLPANTGNAGLAVERDAGLLTVILLVVALGSVMGARVMSGRVR